MAFRAIPILLATIEAAFSYPSYFSQRSHRTARMINGADGFQTKWQFAVFFNFHQPSPMWKVCGGALINRKWVLTVAHCIEDIPFQPKYITVGIGRTRRTWWPGKQNYTVERFVIHPRFVSPKQRTSADDVSIDYDIALVKLSRPVPSTIKPVKLPKAKDDFQHAKGYKCRAAGWGKMSRITDVITIFSNTYKVAKRLQEIDVNLIAKSECIKQDNISQQKSNFFGTDRNLARIICGGKLQRNSSYGCIGDSGSPLVCEKNGKQVLAGLVAGGDKFCRAERSAMYFIDVAKYKTWIDFTLKISHFKLPARVKKFRNMEHGTVTVE